jgi:hypothetical protein
MASYEGYSYRLRAGSPMPTSNSGYFVLHSFMAEGQDLLTDTCAKTVLTSSEFRGQGGSFVSANYTRIVTSGEKIYRASEAQGPNYIEEKE